MEIENERFRNQRNLIPADRLAKTRFVVVGAGAIGSSVVMLLSKMGATDITVYDYDTLEDHNFANQIYPVSAVGKLKVEALQVVAKDYGDCTIKPIPHPWTPDNAVDGDVIISCVDNMDVRSALYNWTKQHSSAKLFIDGRMSARVGRVFGIEPKEDKSTKRYESSLFPQSEASQEPCGQKSIIYTVMTLAGLMVNQVDLWLNNEYRPSEANVDLFNNTISFEYDMERVIESFEDTPNTPLNGSEMTVEALEAPKEGEDSLTLFTGY